MNSIIRGQGTTDSERYLAQLAERSFLNLWSYPNAYFDKRSASTSDGKELCDLLVVCGDHVLIFSDKTIAWPEPAESHVAWSRWYRRAIQKSVDQIRGAQRWLRDFPNRIFIDAACTRPFPIALPSPERRKVHGIVVARGAGNACRAHFKGGSGSLIINSLLKGTDHLDEAKRPMFCIGDVDPDGPFVHVLDDATLDIVLGELNTIADFTSYLEKKERLLRLKQLVAAEGEEELIANYMVHLNEQNEHDFRNSDGSPFDPDQPILFPGGQYQRMRRNPQYLAKKSADEISYLWDELIKAFTKHMLAGTTLTPDGSPFQLSNHEQGVRYMALVPRFDRRRIAQGILEALHKGQESDRFTRAFLPQASDAHNETGFFFMTLKTSKLVLNGGYDQYRQVRRGMLETYALVLLRQYPHLLRIVGIATEPPPLPGAKPHVSEDLILAFRPEWTPDLIADLETRQHHFDIAQPGRYREYKIKGKEFPDAPRSLPEESSTLPNRKQRRAQQSRAKRKK